VKAALSLLLVLAALGGMAACGDDDGQSGGSGYGGSRSTGQAETQAGEQGEKQAGEGERPPGGAAAEKVSTPTIVIRNGEPVDGVRELEYSAGDQVEFAVRSDVADEVHVHGYDLMKDVEPGGTVSFSFPADIEGIFEVELEEHQEQIAELRVNP
jgi:hypothetical protein